MTDYAFIVIDGDQYPVFMSGGEGPIGPQGPAGDVAKVATRTALAATIAPASGMARMLVEAGREGAFVFDSSNLSAQVTADPGQGITVPPASDPTGASGVWVRKFSGPANPKWFGTVGDGVADDTTPIQRALNLIGTLGGATLLIPAGTYIIGSALTPASNTKIVLDGGATVKAKAATAFADSGLFNLDGKTNVEIIGGTIDGNKANNSAGRSYGVQVKNDCSNVRVHGIHIKDMPSEGSGVNGGDGVLVYGPTGIPSDIWIYDNKVTGCSRNGIAVTDGSRVHILDNSIDTTDFAHGIDIEPNGATTLTDIVVSGNTVTGAKRAGVALALNNLSSFSNISVTGNTVKATTDATNGHGIHVNSAGAVQGISVIANSIFDAAANGIFVENSANEGLLISDNNIRSPGGHGIRLASFDKGIVSDNFIDIDAVGSAGIECDVVTEATITGNYVRVNGNCGGVVLYNTSDCVVSSNVFRQIGAAVENGIRIVQDVSASNNIVSGNRARGFSVGLSVESGVSNTAVIGNNFANNTTPISDTGTGTGDIAAIGTISGTNLNASGFPKSVPALTVVANATNSAADATAVPAGSDGQIFRRSGTALAFGAIDLSLGAAVGTSRLARSNQAQVAASRLIGNPTGTLADASEISLGANLGFSGTAIQVQFAATAKLLGRTTAGAGAAEEIGVANGITLTATTLGLGAITPTSVAATGAITSSGGGMGYATGAGGTITQNTSKATGVTLNKLCGEITLNAAALAASTTVSFTLTDSFIAATDLLILNHVSGGTAGSYTLNAQCAAGTASINVRNISLGSLSEAIVIGFAVQKAVTA